MDKINCSIVRTVESHNGERVGSCYLEHTDNMNIVHLYNPDPTRKFCRNIKSGNMVEVIAELGFITGSEISEFSRLFALGQSYPDADEIFIRRILKIDLNTLSKAYLDVFRLGQRNPHNAAVRV